MGKHKEITCPYCNRSKPPNPSTASIQYTCGSEACQRKRKNDWQRNKRKTDAAYREQNARCCREWREKPENKNYWKVRRKLKAAAAANVPSEKSKTKRGGSLSVDFLDVPGGPYRVSLELIDRDDRKDGLGNGGKGKNDEGSLAKNLRARTLNKRKKRQKKNRKSCEQSGVEPLL